MIPALWLGLALAAADLSGQTPAPEDGPTASPSGETALSKKELRRRRRAARRAARAAGREEEGSDAADDAEEAAEAAAEQSRERAARKASGLAENLKGGFGAGQEAAAALPGGPEAGTPGGTALPAGKGVASRPESPADYLLAVRSGYAPALDKAGLRPGTDGKSLVRISDGRPAEAADLARLKQAISAMPAALALRPDFFSRVSPEHFEALKTGYHERPELGDSVYRHVAPTEKDRDLIHSQSCSKVSGGCNESVRRPSYKKGEFVAPEDLERMWKALDGELAETGEDDGPARLSGPRMGGRKTAAPPAFLETGGVSPQARGPSEDGSPAAGREEASPDSGGKPSLLRRIFGPASPAERGGAKPGRRFWPVALLILAAGATLLLRKNRP